MRAWSRWVRAWSACGAYFAIPHLNRGKGLWGVFYFILGGSNHLFVFPIIMSHCPGSKQLYISPSENFYLIVINFTIHQVTCSIWWVSHKILSKYVHGDTLDTIYLKSNHSKSNFSDCFQWGGGGGKFGRPPPPPVFINTLFLAAPIGKAAELF